MSAYVHLFELARGGLGHVSVVMRHDGSYERLFVLKRPHAHLVRDPATRATFLDEARLAGLLRHPHVVSVVDVGQDDDGPFLVMDYVESVHVGDIIRGLAGERAPLGVALEIVRQAAEGLHAAHELVTLDGSPLRVVHRDVSPQNLLVGFDGSVRVTDFGIALAHRRTVGVETTVGLVKGKVGYMSPEQLEGRELDRRADLFSLGIVLVELLTSDRLYHAETHAETARRIVEEDPPDLGELRRDVPDSLVELTFDLLAKQPEDRPASAREVATRLKDIRDELGEEVDLEGFVEDLFAERRQALRARVREARQGRLDHATHAVGMKRRPVVLALLGAILGLGAASWWALGRSEAPVPVAAPPAMAADPIRSIPVPPEPHGDEGNVTDDATDDATDVAAGEATVEVTPAPDDDRSERRQPRTRRRSTARPDGSSDRVDPSDMSRTSNQLPTTSWWPREPSR